MRMILNRRVNGDDGKTENTQGRPDSSYSLQELLIFPQPMFYLDKSCISSLLPDFDNFSIVFSCLATNHVTN